MRMDTEILAFRTNRGMHHRITCSKVNFVVQVMKIFFMRILSVLKLVICGLLGRIFGKYRRSICSPIWDGLIVVTVGECEWFFSSEYPFIIWRSTHIDNNVHFDDGKIPISLSMSILEKHMTVLMLLHSLVKAKLNPISFRNRVVFLLWTYGYAN